MEIISCIPHFAGYESLEKIQNPIRILKKENNLPRQIRGCTKRVLNRSPGRSKSSITNSVERLQKNRE